MKKRFFTVILMLLIFAKSSMAQDLEATKQYLEMQLEILQLQATIDALNNQPAAPTPVPYKSPTSTPVPQQPVLPDVAQLTKRNFPQYAYPPAPVGSPPVWNKPRSNRLTEIYVGDTAIYSNLASALKHIPDNAGEVVIYLVSDTEEPSDGIQIPIGKGITSLRITSNNNNYRTLWPAGRSIWLFCNGIPFIIDELVEFAPKSMIMGGLVTYKGHNVTASSSTIIVNGKAYWVYAGGQSDRDGHISTVNNAMVIINGEVDRVYAGGRAILGETYVGNSTVVVKGTAKEVYCSGYTENTTARSVVGKADMWIYGRYGTYGLGLGNGELVLQNPDGCIN